ncbi:AfsR/SARP family transcriptional regulator [Labedaea rhizosphaerae]|uniref:DNA-binding SARP family transcriptional activator n=1 Tax=Labedaea rhizosphaerae TaxID=598644 RepID=A0A4R6RSR0_LABRH|nr:BTAD domain-containing putative transcriptional regulator [Labedaea rhizosphaerae]TDP89913.1 DNA-binding SARP family transcriptional activator [Labedaea rhizosphaerae]
MELRLFGEVQLRAGGRLRDLGTPRQHAVLAVLAVDAGRPVPIEVLVDRVWDEDPPAAARNVLYSHLSRIRRLLAEAGEMSVNLTRRGGGYVLEIDPDDVDLHRFTHLVERGSAANHGDAERAAALTEALDSWQGTPLAGITGEWAEQVRTTWHRRRVEAAVQWSELQLRLGRAALVLSRIPDLVTEYPLAEPLEALFMKALHAVGRGAEAIERFAIVRRRLADQLGVEPGAELRALHAALLRDELPATASGGYAGVTPAQLPADTRGFAGRRAELGELDRVLAEDDTAARTVVLSGTAGVGKTTLAIHWAHTARARFPGGQLYVNLRGFDPSGAPVTPSEAVRGFLEAFEVPRDRLPSTLEAQIGLYRSLLATHPVLVVLDNARDVEQVRPLLPGAPGCLAVVTSRDQLRGLVTTGAHPVAVDLLDRDEAFAVLHERIGAARVAAEPGAVDEIIDLCARLPLALAVVAARAATHPRFRLAALADQLREARGGLDEFADTDPATDPRAVFSWSYRRLSPAAARLFRQLGLHPGPDIGVAATASLAGRPVRPELTELARAHLITEHAAGRYSCHDLLRAYAAELVYANDSAADRHDAVERVLGHYVHTAYLADGFLDPRREVPPTLSPLPDGAEPGRIADHNHALTWFKTEYRILLTALHQDAVFDAQVWELGWTLRRFLAIQGHWQDELVALTTALAAATRLGDPAKQAFAHCYVGCSQVWLGRYDDARTNLQAALNLYESVDDVIGQAEVHHRYAWMLDTQAKTVEALAHAEKALALYRGAEHLAGQAKELNAVGWFHALLGEHEVAVEYCQEALDLHVSLGDLLNAAPTWDSLGYAHSHLGDATRAVECYSKAIELFRRNGYLINEARTLTRLADVHHDTGDLEAACAAWRHAHRILDQLGHPEALLVLDKLRKYTADRP